MDRSTDRHGAFARARVVSLVLIALAVLGLAYLRFAGSDRVSVPKGAHAGDLILDSCTYATENGGFEADCDTLVVPENRADPQSRLIALPVTRIHAKSDHPVSRSSASRAAPASRTCRPRRVPGHGSCRSRTPDLAASLHSAYGHIPNQWWFLPIREGNVKAAAFYGP